MLEHINLLKNALIEEFYQLYDQYNEDGIYGCTLVFNEYLLIDHLAISTERSLFAENEDRAQYLAAQERWDVRKWRYRSSPAQHSPLNSFKYILSDYFKSQHSFGNPLLDIADEEQPSNSLKILLEAFAQAKEALVDSYGLNIGQILFFIGLPAQPEVEIQSARFMNVDNNLLQSFLNDRQPKQQAIQHAHRFKLSQADKDLLIDVAQLAEVEPYDDVQVAHGAYLLTLEPHFVDTNLYIQKLVQTIAAMSTGSRDSCAMRKDEILERINQFYHASNLGAQPLADAIELELR